MIETNRRIINNDNKIKHNIDEIKKIIELINDFGTLSFGRDSILVEHSYVSLQKIIISVELTLSNLCFCCENGCIADANVLLRKYRDDMFFYLFLLNYKDNIIQAKVDVEIERNVESWINNAMQDLHIGEILNKIQENEKVKNLKYITTVFFVIVILLSPILVMADDYISNLEVGITPLQESQDVVAPFIELFLRKNTIFIDKSCYDFLKENTCMQL